MADPMQVVDRETLVVKRKRIASEHGPDMLEEAIDVPSTDDVDVAAETTTKVKKKRENVVSRTTTEDSAIQDEDLMFATAEELLTASSADSEFKDAEGTKTHTRRTSKSRKIQHETSPRRSMELDAVEGGNEAADDRERLVAFLKTHTCYDIMAESAKMMVLDVQIPLRLAFFVLVENSVKSAPLWNRTKHRHVGLISPTEFITILLHFYRSRNIAKNLVQLSVESWLDMRREAVASLLATIEEKEENNDDDDDDAEVAMNTSMTPGPPPTPIEKYAAAMRLDDEDRSAVDPRSFAKRTEAYRRLAQKADTFLSISIETTLFDASKTLQNHRIHRIPTVDPTAPMSVLGVATHLKMLEYVFRYFKDKIEDRRPSRKDPAVVVNAASADVSASSSNTSLLDRSVRDLGIGSYGDKVTTVTLETPLHRVLEILWRRRISAVPVVDRISGRVVDLYGKGDVMFLCRIQQKYEEQLEMPVSEELKTLTKQGVHNASANSKMGHAHEGLNVCSGNDTLRKIVRIFVLRKAHRLIVLDKAGRCEGVIALSDIFDWALNGSR